MKIKKAKKKQTQIMYFRCQALQKCVTHQCVEETKPNRVVLFFRSLSFGQDFCFDVKASMQDSSNYSVARALLLLNQQPDRKKRLYREVQQSSPGLIKSEKYIPLKLIRDSLLDGSANSLIPFNSYANRLESLYKCNHQNLQSIL